MIKVFTVPMDYLPRVWVAILRYIQEPLEYDASDLTPESVYQAIIEKRFMLWVAYDVSAGRFIAAQTAEIVNCSKGKYCNLVTTGGTDIERWQDTLAEQLERAAIEQGCLSITTRGRMGWLRKLKRNGYKPLYFIAEKQLAGV